MVDPGGILVYIHNVGIISDMALAPLIQPPIMKWLTTEEKRKIRMIQLRHVSKLEKVILPLLVLLVCALLLPAAALLPQAACSSKQAGDYILQPCRFHGYSRISR